MKKLIILLAIGIFSFSAQAQHTTFTLPVQGTVAGSAEGFAPMVGLYDFDADANVAVLLADQWVNEDVTFTLNGDDADFQAFATAMAQPQLMFNTGHTINGVQKSAAAMMSACFEADLQSQIVTAIHIAYRDVNLTTQGDHTAFSYTLTITLELQDTTTVMSK